MISVCIATYNGERFIKEQLSSILQQLNSDDEVIISDDGSSDRTLEIIRELNSPLVKIYINNGEHGYTPNFENAIKHSKGEYIFISDQDDIWLPDKVKVCMDYLNEADFVVSDAMLIDGKGMKIGDSFCALRKSKFGLINNLIRFSYLGCCFAFRRNILDKALPFPSNHVLCTHDNWLAIVAMAFYRSKFISRPLIRYRRYGGNTSSGAAKSTKTLVFMLKYRLYLIWNLLKRSIQVLTQPFLIHNGFKPS